MHATGPTLEQLQRAEDNLAQDVATWRTDRLEAVADGLGQLLHYHELATSAVHAYRTLWDGLAPAEATTLLRHMAAQVLRGRSRRNVPGVCPCCGTRDALVTVYDGGLYLRSVHGGPALHRSSLCPDPPRVHCYAGPLPLPELYDGEAGQKTRYGRSPLCACGARVDYPDVYLACFTCRAAAGHTASPSQGGVASARARATLVAGDTAGV